jgi:hypothetical protein
MTIPTLLRRELFWIAIALAALPQLSVLHAYASAPLLFLILLVLWNIAPLLVAVVMFVAGARYPAWGWLIGVAAYGLWSAMAVLYSERSTAALGFMWAPIWSFLIVGPIGAGVALLFIKSRARNSSAERQDGM